MEVKFENISEKKLVGKCLRMSLANNRTAELWRSFMPLRNTIKAVAGTDLYSLQVYGQTYFTTFNPQSEFEKWALVEVADFNSVPEGIDTFVLPAGLYAVFLYKGPASEGAKVFQYIFGTWLPKSEYALDERPHFEVLGDKYKNNDLASEEEIWIPVKQKS